MKWIYIIALVLLTSCANQSESSEIERWEKHVKNTTIIRDDYGVPHIYGKTDADAVFGLLYAQCEDDFKRVEQNYIWAIGRLAEVEGESAIYSDLRANLFMTKEEAIENYYRSPEWLKELCIAFADGINYYLYSNPDVTPKLINRFEPWMPMYFSEGSIGGDIERVSVRKIKAFYEKENLLAENIVEEDAAKMQLFDEPRGSNGFAISGKLTKSGNAMLLINPHTSFYFRGEVHVHSEEGLNAYGAVTWGQFFVYQGFNEKTGWMHTSTYTDVIDEYIETVEERDGQLVYKYGEEYNKVNTAEVKLKYKSGDSFEEKVFPIYRTRHGPVTHEYDGKWVATAMMWDPVSALSQSYLRTKKDGLDAFNEMMEMRTNSSNNTVYADADGNIAYYHGNFIPKRNTKFDFTKPVDGSNPETKWQGRHKLEECIRVINPENGWIQNCNSTPFTCADEFSPKREDYPTYMSIDMETFRGIHAIDLLKKNKDFTIDKLIEIAYDPYLPAFAELIPGLIEAYDAKPIKSKDFSDAIEVLRGWDFRTSENSVAMSLSHMYGLAYNAKGKAPNGLSRMERIKYFGHQSPLDERLEMFNNVLLKLTNDFGTWNTAWGEINRFQRLNGDVDLKFDDTQPSIPVGLASGRWGALAAFGAYYGENTKRIYGTRGNSFVAVVEFGDKVVAKSMLAGGQSGDPESAHFYDQAQRYVDIQFKEVAFYKADIKKRAVRTYHPGE